MHKYDNTKKLGFKKKFNLTSTDQTTPEKLKSLYVYYNSVSIEYEYTGSEFSR